MGSELCKREGELSQCQSQEFGQGTLKGRSLPGSSVVGETELVTTLADSGEPDSIAFEPIFLGVDDQVVAAPDDFQMGEPTLTKHAGNLGSVGFVVNLSVDGMLPPGLPRHDQATAFACDWIGYPWKHQSKAWPSFSFHRLMKAST